MANFKEFGSCNHMKTLRSHDTMCNLVWIKSKLLDLNLCALITTREFVTGPTVLQQKTVEGFNHFGRIEAVTFQQKSVEGFVLNRSVWKVVLSHVAG